MFIFIHFEFSLYPVLFLRTNTFVFVYLDVRTSEIETNFVWQKCGDTLFLVWKCFTIHTQKFKIPCNWFWETSFYYWLESDNGKNIEFFIKYLSVGPDLALIFHRCGPRYRGTQNTGGSREKLYLTCYRAAKVFSWK